MIDPLLVAQMNVAEQYPRIVYRTPTIAELPPGTILGTWAYSAPGKVRYILDQQRELAPGVLPGDVSRAWVKDEWKLPLRRRKSQFNRHYVLPIHARRGEWGDCTYVDIKGAYLNVLQLGYDIEYIRGRYLAVDPRPIPKVIAGNKFCYALAVAMSNSLLTNLSIVGNESVFTQTKFNMFSNPCLYAFACELLASVASEAMRLMGKYVYYINTDGYIVPTKYTYHLIDIISSWGLDCSVKAQGETVVRGVASWRVGQKETKRADPNARDFTSVMPDKSESLWLKQIFTKLRQNYGTMLTS